MSDPEQFAQAVQSLVKFINLKAGKQILILNENILINENESQSGEKEEIKKKQ